MTAICPFISAINLKVNGSSSSMKSHRIAEWIKTNKQNNNKTQDPIIFCVQVIHLISKVIYRLKNKKRKKEKRFHVNINQKKAKVALIISDKVDKSKKLFLDKE